MNEAKALYTSLMNEVCSSGYTKESILHDAHAESKSKARAIIASVEDDRGVVFAQQCRSQLDEFLDNEFDKIKRRNNTRGEWACNDFKKAKNEAYLHYQRRIDEGSQIYQEEFKLKERHLRLKSDALHDYNRVNKKQPEKYFDEFRRKLETDIEGHFVSVKERNEQNKTKCEAIAEQMLQDSKEQYMKAMDELCNESYVEENVLQEFHYELQLRLRAQIETASESRELLRPFLERCKSELNDLFTSVKKRNEGNRTLWYRIISTLFHGFYEKYIMKPAVGLRVIRNAVDYVKGKFNN